MTALSIVTFVVVSAIAAECAWGLRAIRYLKDISISGSVDHPSVSVIIPARNEGKNLEEALQSVLRLDYPALQIIAVNDRSTDGTEEILRRLAKDAKRLEVVTVTNLPSGWLGKNFALFVGAQKATGQYLLFTDADVVMAPSTLKKAMAYLLDKKLDNVTAIPEIKLPGVWLNILVAGFTVFFYLFTRPWKLRDPKSKAVIGIGAFNLIKTAAYNLVGGHKTIAMRPDDDLKLALILKRNGFRSDVLFGAGMISVEWYDSLRGMIQGLMKNSFAGVDYSVGTVIAATAMQLSCYLFPFAAVFVLRGRPQLFYGASALVILASCMDSCWRNRHNPLYGLGFPLSVVLSQYIIWKSTLTTLINGGITWRGTHYPLKDLKAKGFKR